MSEPQESVTPFFSIITVVRNNLEGLKKTRATIDAQTCLDREWVIIDGNSTDGTREYALQCAGPGVRVRSERDKGIYDAMNKGLRLAGGRYVLFLNSSDLFANTNALLEAKPLLEQGEPDVLFGGSIMRFGDIRIPRPVRSISYIWHGQPGLHQATIFNRIKHLEYPYDLDYPICADYDVMTRMAAAGLNLRSAPILISENEFVAEANSGKNKMKLIKEAARAQRRNLKLAYPVIAVSVLWRMLSSLLARILTSVELLTRRKASVS